MSTAATLRFLAGRYHATPWGSHVNEASVEWPPAPWRLLRALIAVWHRKVSTAEVPEETLERIIAALAASPVHFDLPSATHAHTRHYMPVRSGKGEKPRLVFDGFANVDPEDELVVEWPEASLDEEARRALALLLQRMGYLGRAESWVEARLLEAWEANGNCMPLSSDPDQPEEANGGEVVSVAAPVPPEEYRKWRAEEVRRRGLEKPRLLVREKQLLATLPEKLLDALRLESGAVRRQGWSRPPGLTFVDYLRPEDALRTPRPRVKSIPEPEEATTVRLILSGKPLPRLLDSIRVGEVVRLRSMWIADRLSAEEGDVPAELSGHGMGPDNNHEHAFYLPEDADGDGRIDHVLIHAEAGLGPAAQQTLAKLEKIWLDQGNEWRVIFERAGLAESFRDRPYLGFARRWISVTPYLHPWHRKEGFDVADQLRKECRLRGWDEPDVERLERLRVHGKKVRPVHFHRFRSRPGKRRPQPDSRGSFWILTFPQDIQGPVALGTHCHYGMGIFARHGEDRFRWSGRSEATGKVHEARPGYGARSGGTVDSAVLDEVVSRLVEVARPDRIVLFGSAARDEMGSDSDLDLLVIKEGVEHRGRLEEEIYLSLFGIDVSVDVVVATPEDVKRFQGEVGSVIGPALREGTVVYDAS